MKSQQQMNEMSKHENPKHCNMILLSLGREGEWVWSRIMNPAPPKVNIKLEASPVRRKREHFRYLWVAQSHFFYTYFTFHNVLSVDSVLHKCNGSLMPMLVSRWSHWRWFYNHIVNDSSCDLKVNWTILKVEIFLDQGENLQESKRAKRMLAFPSMMAGVPRWAICISDQGLTIQKKQVLKYTPSFFKESK